MTYMGIGYWREPIFRWVPEERRVRREGWSETWRADPVKLMESLGSCAPDPRVVSYLRQGHVFAAWRGYSFCRFQCGLPDGEMDHRCLTDGIWVWPEGFVHYAAELAGLSVRVGALAGVFLRADGWRRLGYATLRQYARERLGMSTSSLNEKRRLARGSRRLPKAAESLRDGKIGIEAARLVTEVATPATDESWSRRAEDRTVVQLQEEVRAAGMLARIGLNGDAEPPSVEMMAALRALEVRVVTGADLPIKMRGQLRRCQGPVPEVGDANHKTAAGQVSCDALTSGVASADVATTEQISAAVSPCSTEPSLEHGVYAEPTYRELERALAREGRAPRSLRSKGRTTLRLRVTAGTRRTYRWLERLYARYRPSTESFLAYCCSELLAVWAHARPPVAYASVYARDGFRCANPVCGARHVTPHHIVFRSHGGSDEDINVTSLCVDCHLEGAHLGLITVTGSAPDLLWVLGRNAHTVVQGRRRMRAP